MKYTEEQLKAALVRALPDKLRIRKASQYGQTESCVWKENDYKVTQYEWPYIVSLVEDGLTDEQKIAYLGAVAPKEDRKFYLCSILLAKWPARAQALADIGAITI